MGSLKSSVVLTASNVARLGVAAILFLAFGSMNQAQGRERDQLGNEKGSQKELDAIKKHAQKGDRREQQWLGDAYDPEVKEEAFVYKPRPGEKENKEFSLRHRYSFEHLITKSFVEAAKWHEMLAGAGNPDSQLTLANWYYNGKLAGPDDGKDYKKAAQWYLKAAKNEAYSARFSIMYRLAHMYADGRSGPIPCSAECRLIRFQLYTRLIL